MKCSTCGVNWANNKFTDNCLECGGFALKRFCPICDGKCSSIWRRQVSMSNAYKEAFYKGCCKMTKAKK